MNRYPVVFWDVYGTLIQAERGDLDSLVRRAPELRTAFDAVVAKFRIGGRAAMLHESFLRRIRAEHDAAQAGGVPHPEVRIDAIWLGLLEEFRPRRALTPKLAREVALFFERRANPKRLMPEAFDTLTALQRRGSRQGIISNAQFYTPIELRELLREAGGGRRGGYKTLFDPSLLFFSYELGVVKPDPTAFRLALESLAPAGIRPEQCLFVGDSPTQDIAPAAQVGMKALRFAPDGDIQSLSQLLEFT
jgi:putative hydrolase of the HAD superfamily